MFPILAQAGKVLLFPLSVLSARKKVTQNTLPLIASVPPEQSLSSGNGLNRTFLNAKE